MLYESPHFRLEADDRVLTLWLDFRGRRTHALTLPILHELNLVLDRVAGLPTPDVFLIRSGRPGVFLEEFDSAELARFTSALEFGALARRGQEAGRKIAALPFPTAALIDGRCAGAGLELALACNERWAAANPTTRFEFPESARGLTPCWGGTVRLPRLVGVPAALGLLAGGEVGARRALRLGLVDQVIRPAEAAVRLLSLVDRLRDSPRKRRPSLRAMARRASRKWWKAGMAWQQGRAPTGGEGDTDPRAELRRVIAAGLGSEGEGLAAERAAFTRLATGGPARRRLELDRQAGGPVRVFAEPVNPALPSPRRIAVIGGGDLGSRLACRLARLGHDVVVQEETPAAADRANRNLADRLAELGRAGEIEPAEAPLLGGAVRVTTNWVSVENADLAIEAATEDAGVKRNLFMELERRVRPRVPLLTTSTTVAVEAVQAELSRPGRVAGLHLPNPDSGRPVAELVGGPGTDPSTLVAVGLWVREWGLLPVRVADRPGRLVELVKLVYLSEGVALAAEGLPINRIDAGCRRFGMARGPLEWCDEIGLDRLAESVAPLQLARGDRFARNLLFQRLVPLGCVGRDVGEGFYRYGLVRRPSETARMLLWQDLDDDAHAPYVFDPEAAVREAIDRVVLRTINEAAAALTEEPDSDPRMVDVALAFGMGWAPSRGGPLRHADALGLPAIVERLSAFAERFGPRYTPCDELVRRADAGETFYGGSPAEALVSGAGWRAAG